MTGFVAAYGQQLYLLAEAGAIQAKKDGASYWYIDGSFPEEYPINWPDNRISALNTLTQELHIKPIFHGNFKVPLASNIETIREAAVEYVIAEIDIASKLSAPLIIHGGAIVEPRLVTKAKKDALDQYVRSVKAIAAYAKQKNVTILLENLSNYKFYRPFHYIFTTPQEYHYIFEKINDEHVKFFFDVGHAAICEGDPVAVIDEFHHRIWGMSFSNNDGKRDLHLGLGQGLINYHNIVEKIIACQWEGVIAFEVRGREFKRNVSDLEEIYRAVKNKYAA